VEVAAGEAGVADVGDDVAGVDPLAVADVVAAVAMWA
jgi:hypothetical protein